MKQSPFSNPLAVALYVNAALLLGIFVVLLSRGQSALPAAFAAAVPQGPIAGGSGIYIVPGQIHPGVWGCYLLDADHETLCVYEYEGGTTNLSFKAARNFHYDTQLKNYNTSLSWNEVKKLVDDEASNPRGADVKPAPGDAPK
jgi:hypothetical protein